MPKPLLLNSLVSSKTGAIKRGEKNYKSVTLKASLKKLIALLFELKKYRKIRGH
jgi:hypothetical protein